jgi:uncharacterized HAD superfamily protein
MQFRSYHDMVHLVRRKATGLPADIGLVVYVPRSGIIPATLIALQRNLPILSLEAFLEAGADTARFSTRKRPVPPGARVLIVDDSVAAGGTLKKVRAELAAKAGDTPVSFLAVYWSGVEVDGLDHWFEKVPLPRLFEWNFMHHEGVGNFCFDIDGVLCADPTRAQNDDGPAYRAFLRDAPLLVRPTYEAGWLVTSRLEKYRPETEDWLDRMGIRYRELVMLDGVSAETRRGARAHGWFKGTVFRDCEAELFIESEPFQAYDIAQLAAKPALCTENWALYRPDMNRLHQYRSASASLARRALRRAKRMVTGG